VIASALAHDIAVRIPDATSFAKKLAEAAHLPATPSDPDLTVLAPASSSDGRDVVRVSTGTASPPTGTGVVVGARTELDAGLPRKRGPATWLLLGAAGIAVVVVGTVVVTRGPTAKPGAQGGLVATTAEPTSPSVSASPSESAAAASTTKLQPLGAPTVATAETSAAVPPVATAPTATKATTDAGARTTGRPVTAPTPTATTTKAGTTQYGAAGVSTAY
jgi:hypothetical protein